MAWCRALAALVASAGLAAAAPDCVGGACPSDADTNSLLQRSSVQRHRQPYPDPPDDGPNVPDGSQLARQTAIAEINGGGDCPGPVGIPTPPDGLGLGYMQLEKELEGEEPGRFIAGPPFKSCKTCPGCEFKRSTLYDALIYRYRDGNGTLLGQILSPTIKWTVVSYGATTQACFGHTYTNISELGSPCYGFGARINDFFRPGVIEDLMVDSCGEMAMVRLFCANCRNTTTRPNMPDYPQRYQWTFNMVDDPDAPQGFYIQKIDALLDTELTQLHGLDMYPDDPYVCQAFKGPKSVYPPVPQPEVNRVDLPVQDPNTTCSECANCSSTLAVLEPALLAFAKGNYGPLMDLMAFDVVWNFPGQGPTLAACSAARTTHKWAPFIGHGFFARLKAMTKAADLVTSQLYLNFCGQKANFIWWSKLLGKSGQQYTMTQSMAMSFQPSRWSRNGWVISEIIQGTDTEVFMNMASREVRSDPKRCRKIGDYAQEMSRSPILP